MWETDLPLALIMEEILEWEKKPGQEKDKDGADDTSNKSGNK